MAANVNTERKLALALGDTDAACDLISNINAGANPTTADSAAVTQAGHNHTQDAHTHAVTDAGHTHVSRTVLYLGGIEGLQTVSSTRYFGGSQSAEDTAEDSFIIAPVAGALRNLRVHLGTAPGTGENVVLTVRVNGADTGITVTIANTDVAGSDTTNTAAVSAGDRISVSSVTSTLGAPADISAACAFDVTSQSATTGLTVNNATATNQAATAVNQAHTHTLS